MNKEQNAKPAIYFFSATHWDREWYQSFQGFRFRLVKVINEMIEVLEKDSDFKVFHLDGQTIVLEDYLQIEPQMKERLQKLITDQRVIIGPWYAMPDEYLLSGESLIRNLMEGHRICREWGVEAWKYGYICDIFGHIAQMPQIFKGFGIRHAVLGRGTNEHSFPAHFKWKAPDGSECITFKIPDREGYTAFYSIVKEDQEGMLSDQEVKHLIKEYLDYEMERTNIPVVVAIDGRDHEPIHSKTPRYIEMIKELYPESDVKHVDLMEMAKQLVAYEAELPVRAGELNETAKITEGGYLFLITHTLSSRYPVKRANDECQVLLEKWVEPLAAISALEGYCVQSSYIHLAYKYLLQNHPHDSICGCSIDQVYKDMEYRFNQTKLIGQEIVTDVLDHQLGNKIFNETDFQVVLRLWNVLPKHRREVITINLDLPKAFPTKYQEPFGYELKHSFKIVNHEGHEVAYSLVSMESNWTVRVKEQISRKVDRHRVTFEVDVPAMGYTDYKIVPSELPSRYLEELSQHEREAENEFLRLSIHEHGTLTIYDKRTGKKYDQLISYLNDGEIGDGWHHVKPTNDRLITSQGAECVIERVENGPSRTVFKVTHNLSVPDSMEYGIHSMQRSNRYVPLKLTSLIGLSQGQPFIDVNTTVENNAKDHRLRMKLPTCTNSASYFANQPFAFVERKAGVDVSTANWKERDVPEKAMSGIVGRRADDGSGLAFVSSGGLHECSGMDDRDSSLTVTMFRSFGKTVLTNGEEGGQIQGKLDFNYVLVPLTQNTSFGDLVRHQERLQVPIHSQIYSVREPVHPPVFESLFELTGSNVCMSMLKRPEKLDSNTIVVRLYNVSDQPEKAQLNCYLKVKEIHQVNMLEEVEDGELRFQDKQVEMELGPWQIQTYRIRF